MGEVAQTLVSLSGPRSVHGIIPRALIENDSAYEDEGGKRSKEGEGEGKVKVAERTMSAGELERVDVDRDEGEKRGKETGRGVTKETKLGLLTVVRDMHARKKMMSELVIQGGPGSGFVALAGGYGTVEEVMEMVTWNQLGIHDMPIILVNINGYWDGVVQWIKNAVDEGFVSQAGANILVEVRTVEDVMGALRGYQVSQGRYHLDWSQG